MHPLWETAAHVAAAGSSGDTIRGSGAVAQEEGPMAVKAIPEGYHAVTPYLIVDGAARAIEFYTRAFGARELFRMGAPGEKVGHAELQVGDSRIMLADEFPGWTRAARSPSAGRP